MPETYVTGIDIAEPGCDTSMAATYHVDDGGVATLIECREFSLSDIQSRMVSRFRQLGMTSTAHKRFARSMKAVGWRRLRRSDYGTRRGYKIARRYWRGEARKLRWFIRSGD